MIKTFTNKPTAAIFAGKFVKGLPHEIQERAHRKLKQIDAATKVFDLRTPPSNCLEPLEGDRKGQWSLRINDQCRICFRFENGHADDVEIIDYH